MDDKKGQTGMYQISARLQDDSLLQQENQNKELPLMLPQEDLTEVGLSRPKELVAYLLVDNERLEVHQQGGSVDMMREELNKLRENMVKSIDDMSKAHSEEISQERSECQRVKQELQEASEKLKVANQDICRLTSELDVAKSNNIPFSASDFEEMIRQLGDMREQSVTMKIRDRTKMQRAKEIQDRLAAENRALMERVGTLESEKKSLLQKLALNHADQDVVAKEDQMNNISEPQNKLRDEVQLSFQTELQAQVSEAQAQMMSQDLMLSQKTEEDKDENLSHLTCLKQELNDMQVKMAEERHLASQNQQALQAQVNKAQALIESQDLLLNQWAEVIKQMEQDLQRAQNLLTSAERELDNEREKSMDLERQNTLLEEEKFKLCEKLEVQCELQQENINELQLELECSHNATGSLQKDLQLETAKRIAAEEKMFDLQEQLNTGQHQFSVEDLQAEGEIRDLSDTLSALKVEEDQIDKNSEPQNNLFVLSAQEKEHTYKLDELKWEQLSFTQEAQNQDLETKMSEEVQLASQNQLVLQALFNEIQALIKSQDLMLSQKIEEAKHMEQDLQRTKDENLSHITCLKQELNHVHIKMEKERQVASQNQQALQAQVNEAQALIDSQDLLLGQCAEEVKQIEQDLQRAQSLFTSAERELDDEREKREELKKRNILLFEENLKLCAELNQVQTKLVQVEESFHTQAAECERHQKIIKELQLEMEHNSTNHSATTSLHEDLQAERVRLVAAEAKVLELQEQLINAQHQVSVEEVRDLSDTLSALKAQQINDQITRKMIEQHGEELQQHVRLLELKDVSLTGTNEELSHRAYQLETCMAILEVELSKARELQVQLMDSQMECDRLQGELQDALLQLDTNDRRLIEKQSQHETILRQAKQAFLKEIAERDQTIQKLETDLKLASLCSQKDKDMINTVMEANEKLWEEKRELMYKVNEAEEMGSKCMMTARTAQHKGNLLEAENKHLQDRTLKLSSQVSCLQHKLRNTQSCCDTALPRMRSPLMAFHIHLHKV